MKRNFLLILILSTVLTSCGKNGGSSNSQSLSQQGYSPVSNGMIDESVPQNENYMSPLKAAFTPQTSLRDRLKGKLVGAHQGGAYAFSANTVRRFEEAYKAGADIVEMDLHLTKDNVVIIFHDDTLDATTNCKGKISDKTWDEIDDCRRFYLYGISTFEEALQWSHGKVVINAEFKTLDVIKPAIDLMNKYNAKNWLFFQAKGDPERYHIARDYDQNVPLLFVVESQETLDWVVNLHDDNLVVVEVSENSHSPELIKGIHDAGKLVLEDSWHYSKVRELFGATCTPLFLKGIDIAISDRPNSCLNQRDSLR